MKQYIIYGLIDPDTFELKYIGKTINLERRLLSHYEPKKLEVNTHKNNWLKSLLIKNKKAEVIVLETYDHVKYLNEAEIDLIEYYSFIGCNLTNSTNGGDGRPKNYQCSTETKEKISRSMTGQNLGRKLSDSVKWKISNSRKKNIKNYKHSSKSGIKINFSNDEVQDIINKYNSGISYRRLAAIYNCSTNPIIRVLGKKYG